MVKYGELTKKQKNLIKEHFLKYPDVLKFEDFDYDVFMKIYDDHPSEYIHNAVNNLLDDLVWSNIK